MIDIEAITTFLEIAKTGSMSQAAKNLYITQSAISQRIQSLEASMGQTLFNRKYEGVELNRHGKELAAACERLKNEVKILNDWIDNRKNIVGGHIKIASVSLFIDYIFPHLLDSFYNKYEKVKFTIDQDTSKNIEELVVNGDYDFGIIFGNCQKKSLKAIKLMENKVYMVCSKKHPLAKKKNITNEDLKNAKIIWHSDKQSRVFLQVAKDMGFHSLKDTGDIYLSNMESCKIYAMQGLGIAFISDGRISNELANGDLVKIGNFCLDRPVYLISRNEKYQSTLNATFKDMLIKYCRSNKQSA